MLKLPYKPVAIVAGIVGGVLSGLIFKRVWKVVGRDLTWGAWFMYTERRP